MNLNTIEALTKSMEMQLPICFDLCGQRWSLLPDPDFPNLSDTWELFPYGKDDDENIIKFGSTAEALRHKFNGVPLAECWKDATNLDM